MVVEALCGGLPEPRRAVLRTLRRPEDGEDIDSGLVLWFPRPGSFTGEDCAEFQVHGSRAVVDAVLRSLSSCPGCRMAEPGEFALRAFRNGRLDLTEVEGLADLVAAKTEAQRRQALRVSSGGLRTLAEQWSRDLLRLRARVEATVDFIDEAGVADAARAEIAGRLAELCSEVEAALAGARIAETIRDGIKVVIAGPPNAGKSSLLNYLARRDAAIVSSIPGTTRDVIEVSMDVGGLPVIFTDTAGLRTESTDEIEQIGMSRTRRELEVADLVIWLTAPDARGRPGREIDSHTLWVENKADLPNSQSGLHRNKWHYRVSLKSGEGLGNFMDGLTARLKAIFGSAQPGVVVRARQRECLTLLLTHLRAALAVDDSAPELLAEELRAGADALGRLTGKLNVEDVLGEIFAAFCIGK